MLTGVTCQSLFQRLLNDASVTDFISSIWTIFFSRIYRSYSIDSPADFAGRVLAKFLNLSSYLSLIPAIRNLQKDSHSIPSCKIKYFIYS